MMYDNFSDTWITTQIAHSGRQQVTEVPTTSTAARAESSPPTPPADGAAERRSEPSGRRRVLLPPLQEDDVSSLGVGVNQDQFALWDQGQYGARHGFKRRFRRISSGHVKDLNTNLIGQV